MPQHPDQRAAALRSWFLGPHAENEQLFHELIEETVQDHFRWRKSFRPEDPRAISAAARRSPVHAAFVAELRADLRELADELKLELLNLNNESTLNLLAESRGIAGGEVLKIALERYSLVSAGYQDYARTLATRFGDPLEAGVVLVPATAHYSWEKIVRALGIGANQLLFVAVDEHARMDPDNLWAMGKVSSGPSGRRLGRCQRSQGH